MDYSGLIVQKCCRPTEIGNLWDKIFHALGLQHCFIKTDTKAAGMGPARGGPLPSSPIGIPTKIVDSSADVPKATCNKLDCIDETCVNKELQIGKDTGHWMPWNNCNTLVNNILDKCKSK